MRLAKDTLAYIDLSLAGNGSRQECGHLPRAAKAWAAPAIGLTGKECRVRASM